MNLFTRMISLCFLFIGCSLLGNAQTIYLSEDFEADSFPTWTVTNLISWQFGTSEELSSDYLEVPDHSKIAGVNDDLPGPSFNTSGQLISPTFTLTGTAEKVLFFDAYFEDGDYDADERAYVEIYDVVDDTWSILYELGGNGQNWQNTLQIAIPAAYDDKMIQLAFTYEDGDGWNFGFCIDNVVVKEKAAYDASVFLTADAPYTMTTLRQGHPFVARYEIKNIGTNPLNNVEITQNVDVDGNTIHNESTAVSSIDVDSTLIENIAYTPTLEGVQNIFLSIDEPNIGQIAEESFDYMVTESVVAKDDGEAVDIIGFEDIQTNSYGFLGTEYELLNPDTLIGISVYVGNADEKSIIHLLVNTFDKIGESPSEELFRSEDIYLWDGDVNDFLYYEFSEPLALDEGRYVFAVGQDTLLGTVSFGFDDTPYVESFWITSPVVNGGLPWLYALNAGANNDVTLMIRPHFAAPINTSVDEKWFEEQQISIIPNPFTEYLTISSVDNFENTNLYLSDINGKKLYQKTADHQHQVEFYLPDLVSGVYILTIENKEGTFSKKVVRQ